MRITDRTVYRQAAFDVGLIRSQLFDLQRQGATGQKFHSLEDDPTSAERLRMIQEAQESTLHYEQNISRSRTQLDTVDVALEEATTIIIRAKELALAMSTDTISADERLMVADEVQSLYESMLGVANTKAAGEYIFGGFYTDSSPFLTNGTFVGNSGEKEVDVGPSARLVVNVSGEDTFTVSGGIDIFAEIDGLRAAMATDDVANIRASIDVMDQALTQITRGRTDAGLKLNQIDVASAVRTRLEDSLTAEKSQLLDIDPIEVLLDLNLTTTALQNAIQVSTRVINTSLIGI